MIKVAVPVRAGAVAGAMLCFDSAELSRYQAKKVAGKGGQQPGPSEWDVPEVGERRPERLPSWNLARSVIEIVWVEGKITSRARNALASLFGKNEDLTLERLREMILSGELRKVTGIGATTFEEIKDTFV